MSKENNLKFVAFFKNKEIINEIKCLLIKLVGGDEITFNQFTGVLDKDNRLQFYNRKTLLDQRKRFFKRKEKKRSKKNSKEIRMPLDDLVNFLDSLARNGKFDMGRFKKTIIYCIEAGIVVGK